MKQSCERCAYSSFTKGLLGGKTFYCHRYPPQPIQTWANISKLDPREIKSISPEVSPDGWCGEFKAPQ